MARRHVARRGGAHHVSHHRSVTHKAARVHHHRGGRATVHKVSAHAGVHHHHHRKGVTVHHVRSVHSVTKHHHGGRRHHRRRALA
jgi:hypothetical protein